MAVHNGKYVDQRLVVNEVLISRLADLMVLTNMHKHEMKKELEENFSETFKGKEIYIQHYEKLRRAAEKYNRDKFDMTYEDAQTIALARINAIQGDEDASNRDKLMANQQWIDVHGCCAKYSGGSRRFDPDDLKKTLEEIEGDEKQSG